MSEVHEPKPLEVLPNKGNLKVGTYPGLLSGSTIKSMYEGFEYILQLEKIAVKGINILCRIEVTQEEIAVYLS
ncbi:hypothetical protein [Tuwongella immobilis]|uniref:Uncharacterized protein n=1 Tax=Tuwongella immobilis TaxID=692036 RepID=A0A6C2YRI2_9BACT|nr:hypothetical protein [Tuwongella immobilis]VIP03967.1 unnamed protein product [Tuwongella immobilis]VTS05301.1 unnamed protein product [Tuwongella immobilis]